jgi:hypothetical protein
MKIPHGKIWLALLAVFLSFSCGFRHMDYVACTNYLAEEPVFRSQGMYLISALFMPVYIVPWTGFWCACFLNRYPQQPISLFYWFPQKWGRQIFWSLFFGVQACDGLVKSFHFAGYSGYFVGIEDFELGLDAAYNALAELASAYLWLCLRALACYRLSPVSRVGSIGVVSEPQFLKENDQRVSPGVDEGAKAI